ncbi:MAG: hypothetical protein U0R23_05985 [Candidatus Nanopelagicales bacterium]
MASAAVGLAVVLLAAVGGVALDPAGAGTSSATSADAGVAPTGHTTSVDVRIEGMRYVPATIEVPAGGRLLITVHNTGTDRHDLVLETGARIPRIAQASRPRWTLASWAGPWTDGARWPVTGPDGNGAASAGHRWHRA